MEEIVTIGGALMHSRKPDFSGWATVAGLKCADGRVITPEAFKHQDQTTVPLVWAHGHDDPENVLGHVVLEHRGDGDQKGVYCYGFFNDTEKGETSRKLVEHGDLKSLSIFANQLKEQAKNVLHGLIREVSLVMAGANPGALIDNITLRHSDGSMDRLDEEAVIYTGLELEHADTPAKPDEKPAEDEKTVQDVYEAFSDDEKNVVHYMVGAALEAAKHSDDSPNENTHQTDTPPADKGTDDKDLKHMKRNIFEGKDPKTGEAVSHELTHDAMKGIFSSAVEHGSMKAAITEYAIAHGIENLDLLFPDARSVDSQPQWDKRRTEWVEAVLNSARKSPFSRIKSIVADITADEARARGYIKGNFKKEEWFKLAKRTTTPTTVYKKQKLDRDDIIDIVDMDVVSWMKGEMRLMLEEELAGAALIGDGRELDDEDKIQDPMGAPSGEGIRSILHDNDMYAATVPVAINPASTPTQASEALTDAVLTAMELYKGTGQPTFYTTLARSTKMLLARDGFGRRLYRTASELAQEMNVKEIVNVEIMDREPDLIGIAVNLADYTFGADRGGAVSLFEDFDIDYNQQKYLIETRCSGALTKIRSALIFKAIDATDTIVVPTAPAFNEDTGVLTPPTTTGVTYKRADTNATVTTGSPITLTPGQQLKIYALPASDAYHLRDNVNDEWTFKRPSA